MISSSSEDINLLPYRKGVGAMIFNPNGMVWVGRRIDRRTFGLPDAWQMPQGGLDHDHEPPEQAMLRELHEETGLTTHDIEVIAQTTGWLTYDLPHDIQPHLWGGKFRGQEQKWFAVFFHGSTPSINLQTAHPEFDAWQWVHPDDLIHLIVPFKRVLYRKIVAELWPQIQYFLKHQRG